MFLKNVFFVLYLILKVQAFTFSQLEIVKSISDELSKRQIIIVKNISERNMNYNLLKIVKYFSNYQIYVSFQSTREIKATLHGYTPCDTRTYKFNQRTMAVINDAELLQMARLYINVYYGLVLAKITWISFNNSTEAFIKQINESHIPYDCQFFLINSTDKNNHEILEIYNINYLIPKFFLSHFGTWNKSNGISVPVNDFYARRFDLNGTVFGMWTTCNWTELNWLESDGFRAYGCDSVEVTALTEMAFEMCRMMNFRCEFVFQHENNSFKNFYEKYPDSLVEFYIDQMYLQQLSTYHPSKLPIWFIHFYLHVSYNKKYEIGMSSPYIRPFHLSLWHSIVSWIIVSTLFVLLINYTAYRNHKSSENFSLIDACFYSFDSFTNQCGTNFSPKTSSSHITMFAILIPPLFLVLAYSAVIISFITVRIIQVPFHNLEEFIKDGTFKIGYVNNTAAKFWLQETKDPAARIAHENFIINEEDMPQDALKGVERMCHDPKFSFVSFDDVLFEYKFDCQPLQIPLALFKTNAAMAVRPYSPYIKIFSRIINSIRSSGTLNGLRKRKIYIDNKTKLLAQNTKSFLKTRSFEIETVDYDAVESIFILLGTAYLISIIILLLEFYIFRKFPERKIDSKKLVLSFSRMAKTGRLHRPCSAIYS